VSVFYDHLLGLDEIHQELLGFELPSKQHYHLLKIADSALHHDVLNLILIELPQSHHEYFLYEFHNDPENGAHLDYVRQFSPEIETKIQQVAHGTKKRILDEIKGLKNNN
jgi:hypothetical protein